jgi:predicted transcriptional regulator
MGKRFVGAWKRAAAGEAFDETHVTFLDVQTMLDTLSPRRLELLRHVRQHGAGNVRELARALGRDYKNVHQDVATLETAGLLLRDGRKLAAPWDELQASVSLVPA